MHVVEGAERREPYADIFRPPHFANRFDYLEQQLGPTLARPAVFVRASVCAGQEKLVEQIPVCCVHFDAVHTGSLCVARTPEVLAHEVRHLFALQCARRDAGREHAFAALILDERLRFRPDGRRRNGQHFIGLQGGVRYASYVP